MASRVTEITEMKETRVHRKHREGCIEIMGKVQKRDIVYSLLYGKAEGKNLKRDFTRNYYNDEIWKKREILWPKVI
jgi:hypothetical protein